MNDDDDDGHPNECHASDEEVRRDDSLVARVTLDSMLDEKQLRVLNEHPASVVLVEELTQHRVTIPLQRRQLDLHVSMA